jgi:hypothetical protein
MSLSMVSSGSTLGRTSRGSCSHLPNLSSALPSVRYNPNSVSSVVCSGHERKCRLSKHDSFSDDDDDDDDYFTLASLPASNEVVKC